MIDQLTTPESLLVISFRLWALPYAQPQQTHPDWRAGFQAAGMHDAARAIVDPLLATVFTASRHLINVHRMQCRGVSPEELRFLRCITHYQHENLDDAMEILAAWLHPGGVRVAASLAPRLASAMDAAGLMLPQRETGAAMMRRIPTGAGGGVALLH
jgi:hypothetical protein